MKAKRKRIRAHLTDPTKSTSSSTCTANADIHSRLDILEKSNVIISDNIQAIKSDVTLISACLPDGSSVKSPTQHSKPAGNDHVCIEKLKKSNQEINLTLEKTERAINTLQKTLSETAQVKKDLEAWRESVFKSQDSERIEQIFNAVKSGICHGAGNTSAQAHETVVESKFTAKSPSETKTSSSIPGLPPSHNDSGRDSYRRQDRQYLSERHNVDNRRKRKSRQNHQTKIVLLTDSVMQPFKSGEFPKSYDVKVLVKKSTESITSNLQTVAQEVAEKRPDAVYVHLATHDIAKGKSPATTVEDLGKITEALLRETSQSCQVFISHPVSCNVKTEEFDEFSERIQDMIKDRTENSTKSVFWNRVSQNKNSNFYLSDGTPNVDLFNSGRINLNDRGLRVIMGNFRHSLHSHFSKVTLQLLEELAQLPRSEATLPLLSLFPYLPLSFLLSLFIFFLLSLFLSPRLLPEHPEFSSLWTGSNKLFRGTSTTLTAFLAAKLMIPTS